MPSPVRRALRALLGLRGPLSRAAAPGGPLLRAAERLVGLIVPKNASGNNASVR